MKSKTKIGKQLRKKINPELVETIKVAKKHKNWLRVASVLSGPKRNHLQVNLSEIKEDIIIPGKVLSQGESFKGKVVAFSFSSKAKEKILKAGGKAISILEEIKLNPEAKGLKIIEK